ncbi:hypothetical protein Q3198_19955, partial [Clostridioides difficile]
NELKNKLANNEKTTVINEDNKAFSGLVDFSNRALILVCSISIFPNIINIINLFVIIINFCEIFLIIYRTLYIFLKVFFALIVWFPILKLINSQ